MTSPTAYTVGKRSLLVSYCFQIARLCPTMTAREAETLCALSRAIRAIERRYAEADGNTPESRRLSAERSLQLTRAWEIVSQHDLTVTATDDGLTITDAARAGMVEVQIPTV